MGIRFRALQYSPIGILSAGVALLLALQAAQYFNDAPVPIFLTAVLVSAWLGGGWPGAIAIVLSTLSLIRFFDLSRASPLPGPEDTAFDVALFVVVASVMTFLTAYLRFAVRRVEVARAEAEGAGETRDAFVAAAAHDLKSPLAGIQMAAQLAQTRLQLEASDQPALEPIAESLTDIEDDARRLGELLEELLDVAHLQAGRPLPLHTRSIHMLDMVEPLVASHQAKTTRHEIRIEALADPVGVWDPVRVSRVIDNLLSNAVKYSPQGGQITVTVLEETSADGASCATVRVNDHGVGIPADDLQNVFERFFRARNVGRIAGSGIGLAGARATVEQHGGTLEAESHEGAGSTFILRLPATQATAESANSVSISAAS
jgi:signal transduction histidine kinase